MSYSVVFDVHSIIIDITVINVWILLRRRRLPLILVVVLHHRISELVQFWPILGIVLEFVVARGQFSHDPPPKQRLLLLFRSSPLLRIVAFFLSVFIVTINHPIPVLLLLRQVQRPCPPPLALDPLRPRVLPPQDSLALALVLYSLRSTSTLTLEGGHVVVSDAAATVMAARSVADGGIDADDPAAAAMSADNAASSMLEKGKRNKNGTKDIDIQAFDAVLQLGVGCRLMV
jgi:hypothetical protein